MRVLALFCLFVASSALRKRRSKSRSWTTKTDANRGPCAGYMNNKMPVYIPLVCTGDARNLVFRASATGSLWPRLRLSIDNIDKGFKEFPIQEATRTWSVTHDSLSAGVHIARYSGDRLALRSVEVSGDGGTCSFDTVPGYDSSSYINTGMDVITRVFGPKDQHFSEVAKRGIYFSSEVLGVSDDKSISALAMGEGIWEWMYEYSKEQSPDDQWLSNGRMYDESDITPYPNVSLDQFPGRFGDEMVVQEPCNTVSNIIYSEASVWLSCKHLPFPKDDMATMLGSLHAMGAGSAFMHASSTSAGHIGDVMPIKLMMLEMHQMMAKSLLDRATGLTQAERDAFLYLGRSGLATDHARTLTGLFRGQYSRTKWYDVSRELDLPAYELSIAASILTVVEALDGRYAQDWQEALVTEVVNFLLDAVGGSDFDWVKATYRPAVAKVFDSVTLCASAAQDLYDDLLAFALTFVEAFAFQEELVEIPQSIRDIISFLESIGLNPGSSEMVETWDLYNGERAMCIARSPHATWHEKAAHGLVHLTRVAEIIMTRTNC